MIYSLLNQLKFLLVCQIIFGLPNLVFLILTSIRGVEYALTYRIQWFIGSLSMLGLSITNVVLTSQVKSIVMNRCRTNQVGIQTTNTAPQRTTGTGQQTTQHFQPRYWNLNINYKQFYFLLFVWLMLWEMLQDFISKTELLIIRMSIWVWVYRSFTPTPVDGGTLSGALCMNPKSRNILLRIPRNPRLWSWKFSNNISMISSRLLQRRALNVWW